MSVVIINKENFENEVLKSEKTVLLDFWASWCGPCRMVSPIVDEIADEYPEYKVGKVNVDEQPELASAFEVMSIPSLFVLKDGKVVKGVNFEKLKDVASPIDLAKFYSDNGADELVFYGITASAEGRKLFTDAWYSVLQ